MPIFEYLCQNCGKAFERLVLKSDEAVACPKCGQESVSRQMSACAFKTDYHGFMSTPSSGQGSCGRGASTSSNSSGEE